MTATEEQNSEAAPVAGTFHPASSTPALIGKHTPREWYPLSSAQQGLWYMDQLALGKGTYHIPVVLELEGVLEPQALGAALNALVERHEVLRTRFRLERGQGAQMVVPFEFHPLPVTAVEDLREDLRQKETLRLIEEQLTISFNLDHDPPVRWVLIRLGAARHVLVLTLHHLVSDGWSLGVLAREVGEFYSAAIHGRKAALAPLPIQYVDYACWEQSHVHERERREDLNYWKSKFEGFAPSLILPTDYRRQEHRGIAARVKVPVREGMLTLLQDVAGQEDATPFMIVATAYCALLRHWSRECAVVLGTDVAARHRPETEPLIGYFINRLILKIDLDDESSLREVLATVRSATMEALSHQAVPYYQLIQTLNPPRISQGPDITPAVLVYDSTPPWFFEQQGLQIHPRSTEFTAAKYDLALVLRQTDVLTGYLEYDTGLFEKATIEEGALLLSVALQAICEFPFVSLRDLLTRMAETRNTIRQNRYTDRRRANTDRLRAIKRTTVAHA